mgnify:CR=1 FL=1
MAKELFERIDRKVEELLIEVLNGRIGLPDLQRPFVWSDAKVRDLLDSMMRGFPIGYVMLWASPEDYGNTKTIGNNEKRFKKPDNLVIDGQQRLTSILSAMTDTKVKDDNFKERSIRIAFNPLTKQFEVWTKAIERDYKMIPDIAEVYRAHDNHQFPLYRRTLIKRINEGRIKKNEPLLTEDEEFLIESNLILLLDLRQYTIPTLRILPKADEEDVAEIFRRVNSGGQKLNENNFIETLLAVYANDIHDEIMQYCADSRIPAKATSYNPIIELDPSHIIRMVIAYGFRRARMKYGYKLLRGDDLEIGINSEEIRQNNLQIFRDSLERVININDWHSFINLFAQAGYLRYDLLSSKYVVVFSYALYLIGKYDYKVPQITLQKVIIRWIFMTTIKSYYSYSPESTVERQMADLRSILSADEYVNYLDNIVKREMNDSYFSIELVESLTSSSAISPVWFGYLASLNIIGTPMLFSNTPQAKYWLLGSDGDKKAIDKHHIFPKDYLESIGIDDDRERNQLANFTYLEYQTNIDISNKAPSIYMAQYKQKFGNDVFELHCVNNAIPIDVEKLEYNTFLQKRRKLMSDIIKKAYNKLWDNN